MTGVNYSERIVATIDHANTQKAINKKEAIRLLRRLISSQIEGFASDEIEDDDIKISRLMQLSKLLNVENTPTIEKLWQLIDRRYGGS